MNTEAIVGHQDFAKKMERIESMYDGYHEKTHSAMDKLMCKTLKSLGYGKGIKIFEESKRWYA